MIPRSLRLSVMTFLTATFTCVCYAAPLLVVSEVHLVRGIFAPGSQPDGNSVILDAPDGLIVVDTGRHAAHTQQLLDFAHDSGRPITAVINTHWHLDHVGGNLLIKEKFPDAKVYATDALTGAMTGFLAGYKKQLEEMLANPATDAAARKNFENELDLIRAGKKLGPDVVITKPGATTISERKLYFGFERNAVTAGDLWVRDEKTGVLIAGDLVTLPAPFLDTACPARWKDTLERLQETKFDILVPGHGAPMTRTQFATYRAAFADFLACGTSNASKSRCVDAWVQTLQPMLTDDDPAFSKSVLEYYVDVLKRDPAKIRELCGN